MAKKKKGKVKAGKKASRKPAKKRAAKKKTTKKKAVKRKAAPRKKTKKKALKKKTTKKRTPQKTSAKKKPSTTAAPTSVTVEPGPPPGTVPPVEEPAANEEAIGIVTHYYSHLGVVVVQINKGSLRTGDMIHLKGHTTDFSQRVESMEYEHQNVQEVSAGQSVGIKIKDSAREHDILYRVK